MQIDRDIVIHEHASIHQALVEINRSQKKALICVDDEDIFKGIVTDGDIRRGLIRGADLSDHLNSVMNRAPVMVSDQTTSDEARKLISARIRVLPVIDSKGKYAGYYTYQEETDHINILKKRITILGMGYVGLTLGLVLAEKGFKVSGFDTNKGLIEDLNERRAPFYELGLQPLLDRLTDTSITFHDSAENIQGDVYIVTVGTPLLPAEKLPNIDHIRKALTSIGNLLEPGNLVILRSTVPIGCTREIALPILEECSGLECGTDFYLAFAPERTAEGVALQELKSNPQIIGANDDIALEITSRIFQRITPIIIDVSSIEAAECCKLMDNTYRDHIFAYANNMAHLAESMGLDFHEMANAVNFGYKRNQIPKPSPGVGGPCLSKDPYILAYNFNNNALDPTLVLESRRINEAGPEIVYAKLIRLLQKAGKSPDSASISIVGMAFKGDPETSDLRDSTSLWFTNLFPDDKKLNVYDAVIDKKDLLQYGFNVLNTIEEAFEGADVVVFLNNHKSYKKLNLVQLAKTMNKPGVLIDTWNNFSPTYLKQLKGIIYGGLGND